MTKNEKIEIFKKFLNEIEKLGIESIETDPTLYNDPIELVHSMCDFLENEFNKSIK